MSDMQAEIADWIVRNDGCGSRRKVDCGGNGGYFKGTRCPISNCGMSCFLPYESKLACLREWLEKYHQEKAEAAEAEKRKIEVTKKQEQGAKQEPKKICGNCQHASESVGFKGTIPCKWRNINVPAGNPGCHYFEPRNTACQPPSVSSEDVAEAVACAERYTEQNPSDTVPFRAAFFDVLKENRTLRNRLDKTAAEYSDLVTGALATKSKLNRHEERVFQLEKENAMLAHKIRGYKKGLRLAKEPCGKCSVKENNASLVDKCERLTEQRNKLSNDLIQATRMVKEIERNSGLSEVCCSLKTRLLDQLRKENAKLRSESEQILKEKNVLQGQCECLSLHNKKAKDEVSRLVEENARLADVFVDCTAKWNGLGGVCVEKDGLIDRLRNANSRSISEMYRAEAELKDERRREKEIEKENVALRSKLEQAAEDRKRELHRMIELERQLSKALSDQWFRERR